MPRWLKAWFAWREVCDQGVWLYMENTVTGARKAIRISRCFAPLDFEWLGENALVVEPRGNWRTTWQSKAVERSRQYPAPQS